MRNSMFTFEYVINVAMHNSYVQGFNYVHSNGKQIG